MTAPAPPRRPARRRVAALEPRHKIYIVQRLAAFDEPHEVARALRERFGVELSLSGIRHYDPTRFRGRRLARPWRDLFTATRKRILARQAALGAEIAALRHQETLGAGNLADGLIALDAKLPRHAIEPVALKPASAPAAPQRQYTDEEIDQHIRFLLVSVSCRGKEMLINEFGNDPDQKDEPAEQPAASG